MAERVSLQLPAPPSSNTAYVAGPHGRYVTGSVRAWRKTCAWMIEAAGAGRIGGRVIVLIGVERREAAADIDNRIKLTLDVLVRSRVIDDDRHVAAVIAAWTTEPNRGALERAMDVLILPAGPLTIQFQPTAPGARGGWFLPAPETEEPHDGD